MCIAERSVPWTEAISSGTPQRNGRLCLRDSVGKLHSFIVNASPLVSSGKAARWRPD
jgi:hypothetical protein